MRDIFLYVFSITKGEYTIELFSVWHFLYIILILCGTIGAAIALIGKTREQKDRVLRRLAFLIPVCYILDFFIMPLASSDFSIDVDKLPFHICTLLGILIPFVQFHHRLEKYKDVIVCLAVVASLMYITYPGSAIGDILPWCYKVVQTFLYHGLLFAWGVLSLTTGSVVLSHKKLWRELVFIIGMTLWASLGNTLYSHEGHVFDWFFVNGVTFPFVPKALMPFAVIAAVFAMCALVCAIYESAVKHIEKNSDCTPKYAKSKNRKTSKSLAK